MWHLAASVVATEDIDARDWMHCTPPDELTAAVARALGAGGAQGPLTERLGRDLWLDFVADTGDDADVSAAVADMIFRTYRVPDGDEEIVAPRGDALVFGGDTAYPVATEWEIHNRVGVPFNRVLRARLDGQGRVLLGIPGNHDWYSGLDGFARMFRARRGSVDRASMVEDDSVDTGGQIGHLLDWVEAFRVGHFVAKRPTLPLLGYTTVQNASYFSLHLAPELDLWGVDRQLRTVDYGQRNYFMHERAMFTNEDGTPGRGLVVLMSDPAYSMLEPYHIGQRIMQSLELTFEKDAPLVMTGDTHHYCRQVFDRGMHVIAGGGGAFMHPARIARTGFEPPAAEFPGPRASRAMAWQVPLMVGLGRAGIIVHAALVLTYLPLLGVLAAGTDPLVTSLLVAGFATLVCGTLGGWRKRRSFTIGSIAAVAGAAIGFLPWGFMTLLAPYAASVSLGYLAIAAVALSIIPAATVFGLFLAVLTVTGLEQHQAFSALAHPGYKHFVRLRIRKDGSAVDGWVIGKVDTLREGEQFVLVDQWTWNNPAHEPAKDDRRADRAKA